MSKPSPFPPSSSTPGAGVVHLTLQPPFHPVFSTLSFSYPLKLVVSASHKIPSRPSSSPQSSSSPALRPSSVPLLFLLSYGGGLVSGDHISLSITLSPSTRLTIATQGSTKIFRPPPLPPSTLPQLTRQDLRVNIGAHAALWLAPDPCQPFAHSRYAQSQIFELDVRGGASLGLVDWLCEGRSARGEKWACESWRGRNEVWDVTAPTSQVSNYETAVAKGEETENNRKKCLLLRDNIILSPPDISSRVDGLGIFGTVILVGPLLSSLAQFFISEFKALPRIGARDWSSGKSQESSADPIVVETEEQRRARWCKRRQEREKRDGVLWTAASVRGAVVVKFGAREVEGAKVWLGDMLMEEGTTTREFGPGGLMCVK
ncbi:MAG: hypothetical protein LQ343_007495 [Gyalolechia ehrenbergii]|nr:MAG: hypothetical protein LQ343_007495 [Gyalolechia ehrenbergii]